MKVTTLAAIITIMMAAIQPAAPPQLPAPPAQPALPSPSAQPPESPQTPAPPPSEPTFRTRASGVRFDVLVTDGDRPIPNLTAADFELTDNGVAQQVEVTRLFDLPVDVIIVLDTSASLGADGLEHLLHATDTLLGSLRASDRAALVTFSRVVTMRSALTLTHHTVRDMLKGLKAEGTTSVIDATYAATTLLQTQEDRAALLLVFSDGVDTSSWLRPDKVLQTVRRSAVVPYAIVVGDAAGMIADGPAAPAASATSATDKGSSRPPEPREPLDATDSFLRDLVVTGGGVFMPAAETRHLEGRFAEALDNFRQRYVLTYTPRGVDAAGWHPVTVKVKGRHRVRARPGYLVQ
jgi:VWFA-related protein